MFKLSNEASCLALKLKGDTSRERLLNSSHSVLDGMFVNRVVRRVCFQKQTKALFGCACIHLNRHVKWIAVKLN
jgi:hypothetical protein